MTAKSQIDIDVNSAEFQEFKSKFDKYCSALENVPDAWKKIGQSTSVAKTNFETMAAGMAVVGTSFAAITKSADEFYRVTTATSRYWKELAVSTGSVAKNIVAATESLLKWTGILSLVTGGGGLFGFDRLAHSVAGQRIASMGTGGDYGKRAAFLNAFENRLDDPAGLLGRISEDQANFGKQLRKLGLTEAQTRGDPADVAMRANMAAAKLAATEPNRLGQDPRLSMYSVPELRQLVAMLKSGELQKQSEAAQNNANRLNLPPDVLRAYTDFIQRMSLAGRQIETIFAKGLVKLENPLAKLSQNVINLVEKFTNKGGPLDEFIGELSKGVEWLADVIGTDEFQKDVNSFIGKIGSLAGAIGSLLSGIEKIAAWFGVDVGLVSGGGAVSQSIGAPGNETSLVGTKGVGGQRDTFGYRGGGTAPPISGAQQSNNAQESWNFWKSQGYSDAGAATMLAMERGESGFNPNAIGDRGRSRGAFQWDPTRRAAIQRATGIDVNTAGHMDQLRAENWESQHGDPGAQRLRNAIMGGADINQGVHSGIYDFERSRHKEADIAKRLPYARSALQQYGKKPTVNINSTPGGNNLHGANAAAAGSP